MAFGLDFFTLAPGLRVAGDSLAYVYKFTKKGGQGDGKEGLEVGLTDDPAIKLLEAAVSGYDVVTDRDAVYTALVSGGLTELVPGLAVGIDSYPASRPAPPTSDSVLLERNLNCNSAAPTSLA